MTVGDMPTFVASAYGHGSTALDLGGVKRINPVQLPDTPSCGDGAFESMIRNRILKQAEGKVMAQAVSGRRYVQVIISDPHPLIPLDKCILYEGKPLVTDLTDQELFYEINLKEKLEQHNNMRVAIVDKTVKDRTEYLEPARIRDLKMNVIKIADL